MPCNLTARADAKVSNEALAKMLTQEVVKRALRAFAAAQGLKGETFETTYGPTETQLWVGDVQISVTVNYRGMVGEIGCFVGGARGRGVSAQRNELLAQALKAHMLTVAGALMQEKIRVALMKRFQVEKVQRAQDGTMVLTLDVGG